MRFRRQEQLGGSSSLEQNVDERVAGNTDVSLSESVVQSAEEVMNAYLEALRDS